MTDNLKKLTDEEKKEIIKSRYSDSELFKRVLELTVKKMEENPYCRKILEGANYYTDDRPSDFDAHGFYLEDIYVGKPSWGPSGHCTKERYQFDKDGDENINGTHDAVYINEETLKFFMVGAIKKLNIDIPLEKEILDDAKFEEFCSLPKTSEDYYKKTKSSYILSLYNYHKFQEEIEKMKNNEEFVNYLSDVLLNTVAHECSHANQMNNDKEWEAQNSCALPFNTSEDRENFVNKMREIKQEVDFEKQLSGRSSEVIAEAGVMAHSYVVMLLVVDDRRVIDDVNSTYEPRCDISKINPDMKKIRAVDENGNYTQEAIKEQQRIAREIVSGVCKKLGCYQMNLVQKITNCDTVPEVDYNCDETFSDIKSSYQEYIFGTIDEYIKAIPAPGLSKERQEQLKKAVKDRSTNTIDNPAPKLSPQIKSEIKKEKILAYKSVKKELGRARNMLPKKQEPQQTNNNQKTIINNNKTTLVTDFNNGQEL